MPRQLSSEIVLRTIVKPHQPGYEIRGNKIPGMLHGCLFTGTAPLRRIEIDEFAFMEPVHAFKVIQMYLAQKMRLSHGR
mgnify:CR=1 FL=1